MPRVVSREHIITGKVLHVEKLMGYCVANRIELVVQDTTTKNRQKIRVYYDDKEYYYGDADITVVGDIVEVNEVEIERGLLGMDIVKLIEVKILEKTE